MDSRQDRAFVLSRLELEGITKNTGEGSKMRLVTFVPGKGAPRVGLIHGGNYLIDLTQVAGKPPFDP